MPAVGYVDHEKQQHYAPETGERDLWIVPAPVILAHTIEQHYEGKSRPAQLPQEKVGIHNAELQFGAVTSDQAEADQYENGEEENPICFEPLRHR